MVETSVPKMLRKQTAEIQVYVLLATYCAEMQDYTLKTQDPYQPRGRGGGKF